MLSPSTARAQPETLPDLLLVDPEGAGRYLAPLAEKFRVTQTGSVADAVQHLSRTPRPPSLLVTELTMPDGSGIHICQAAKRLARPATVLVTTAEVERVPDALAAGCDAVLLKPFPANLLFARLGRLARAAPGAHAGSNEVWPTTPCPHCGHVGVTSFEHASYRRAWYACLACKGVWLAKRRD